MGVEMLYIFELQTKKIYRTRNEKNKKCFVGVMRDDEFCRCDGRGIGSAGE